MTKRTLSRNCGAWFITRKGVIFIESAPVCPYAWLIYMVALLCCFLLAVQEALDSCWFWAAFLIVLGLLCGGRACWLVAKGEC